MEIGLGQDYGARTVLAVQGDDCLSLNNLDVGNLIRFHEARKAKASILLSAKPDLATHKVRFVFDSNGLVTERTPIEECNINSGCVAGVYCFNGVFLRSHLSGVLPRDGERRLTDLLEMAMAEKSLYAVVSQKSWYGINNEDQLLRARNEYVD